MRSIMMAAALGLMATPAMAVTTSIYVSGQSGTYANNSGPGPRDPVSGSTPDGDYVAAAAAGVLKSSITSDLPVNTTGMYTVSGMTSVVSFTDVLTVSAPGLTSGSFVASLIIDGLLSPRASSVPLSDNGGYPNFEIKVELPDLATTVFDFNYTASNQNGVVGGAGSLNGMRYGGPYTGTFNFSIPFDTLVGQTVKVSLTCAVFAQTRNIGDTAGGTCDFAHTVTWGGVSQVLNQHGNVVTGVNITGATGANYAQSFAGAVPEPASWAMMLAGFGLAGAALRRQRRALPA
ncbi:PEPxxWA-CTERM sorting domain-containing protein [Sandarakinorhabdus cyanobacteriorum]|nr:PEPxxWA-CTERM sorting domain-containing protein [Sandarakinorhabdus cyanobacteriorum]